MMSFFQISRQSLHLTVFQKPLAVHNSILKTFFAQYYSNRRNLTVGLVSLAGNRNSCLECRRNLKYCSFRNISFNANYGNHFYVRYFTPILAKHDIFNGKDFAGCRRIICAPFSSSTKRLKDGENGRKINQNGDCKQNNDSGGNTSQKKKIESNAKEGSLAKFKNIVNQFWLGCKQLMWIDARKAYATRKKLKRHDYDLTILTREELRHMRQTRKDMIKSLPVALLFFLPFIGYFAPIIGFLFPKKLLSHQFWDVEQRKKFAFEDHVRRSQYYLPLIQEVGWSSRELKNQDLFELCIKAIDGNHLENDDLLVLQDIFNDILMKVDKMPRFHLEKLCKTWLLPVKWYIPSKVLRELLTYRIKQIIEDDDAIRREGMDSLSDLCIRQACHARGLDKSSFDVPVMKDWLQDWMHLTKKVTDGNLSFVAHCAVFKTINFGKDMENDKGIDMTDFENEENRK